jgi:hypothetical protein
MNLEVEIFKCLDENLEKNYGIINIKDKEVESRMNELFHTNLGSPEEEESQLKWIEVPRFLAEMNIPTSKQHYSQIMSRRKEVYNTICLEEWFVWKSAINEVFAVGQCGPLGWPKKNVYISFDPDRNSPIKGFQLELIGLGTPLIELASGKLLIEQRIGEKTAMDKPMKVYKLPPTIKRLYHNWIVQNEMKTNVLVNFRKSYLNENGKMFVEFFNKEEYTWKTEKFVENGVIKKREIDEEASADGLWKKVFSMMTCQEEHDQVKQEPLVCLNWEE